MQTLPNIINWAVPGFVLLMVIEIIWAKRRAPTAYEPRDTLSSLAFGLGSTVAGRWVSGSAYFA